MTTDQQVGDSSSSERAEQVLVIGQGCYEKALGKAGTSAGARSPYLRRTMRRTSLRPTSSLLSTQASKMLNHGESRIGPLQRRSLPGASAARPGVAIRPRARSWSRALEPAAPARQCKKPAVPTDC